MLKEIIINSLKKINFQLIIINNPERKFLNLIKKNKTLSNKLFLKIINNLSPKEKANLIFFSRVLDFNLWQFRQNWQNYFYQNKKKTVINGYFNLLLKTKKLLKNNIIKIDFEIFKKIISPQEKLNLAKLRFKLFKEAIKFLKNYDFDFNNYFEEFKKPKDFCFNLMKMQKFQDYYKNIYFLKPNQLLYYEYLLALNKIKNFQENLNELTIFADYKIPQILIHFNLMKPKEKLLEKIKNKKNIKIHSKEEIELRAASIILGEIISEKAKIPNYLIDNILWDLSHKIKLKYPPPLIKTIFY